MQADSGRRQECSGQLQGEVAAMFENAVALCPAVPTSPIPTGPGAASLVREFAVVCPEGEVADDCIPKCQAAINGAPHTHCCTAFSKHGQLAMPRV